MSTAAASHPERYIGLMSGTSMDSVDAVLVELAGNEVTLIGAINHPLPARLRADLVTLCSPGTNEIEKLGVADRETGRVFAAATLALLEHCDIPPEQIRAIGSHGQTIRHRPGLGDNRFTLQIGDPNTIAELTGICTVADFRRRDLVVNGQGAPLAPAFHDAVFRSPQVNRAVVNIGGMANITILARNAPTLGFDTGPGNVLMDGWVEDQRGDAFDRDGQWAGSGQVNPALLAQLMAHPFISLPPPKSTGREDFNLQWLRTLLPTDCPPEDIQATLLEFTARTIATALTDLPEAVTELHVCGGGAYNGALLSRLQDILAPCAVSDTSALGIPAEWVEGAAFAWLAQQTLADLPGNLPAVTGADHPVILGAIYPGRH